MKILVLGGTGAIGYPLAKKLALLGHEVVVTSRKKNGIQEKIKYVQGNAKNNHFLKKILQERWDVVVDFMNYSTIEFKDRVQLLLESTRHYVFLSSARVYGGNQKIINEKSSRLIDSSEDEIYLSTDEYSLSKARQENLLKSSSFKNYTIVRPYITYSERRFQLGTIEKEGWIYRALKGKKIVFSKDLLNSFTTLTSGIDVARIMAKIIEDKSSFGEIYNVTNNYSNKWKDVLKIYLDELEKKMGKRPKVVYQNLDDFLEWNGEYHVLYDRFFDRQFDNSKISKYINLESFVNINEGLRKCLNSFLSNPQFNKIDWKSEAIKDRFTHENTKIKEIEGFKEKCIYLLFRYFIRGKGKTYKLFKLLKKLGK